ncbi:MAG: DUF4230 domain-containing protein [Prevotella sp.]|nr:DUF4230 domain-containing protein [Prevotella sp.]
MDKNTRTTLITCGSIAAAIIAVAVAAALLAGSWLWRKMEQAAPAITITNRREVTLTPTQIQSIRDIGQWEFLSVDDEELVDTMRPGILFDDHLVCIYRGTLRLGLDMQELSDASLQTQGDSISVLLPQIELLDEYFIDDARTEIFHEEGEWSSYARDDLYRRAREQMKMRAMTADNIRLAQQMAETQMRQLFQALGFAHVSITFDNYLQQH